MRQDAEAERDDAKAGRDGHDDDAAEGVEDFLRDDAPGVMTDAAG